MVHQLYCKLYFLITIAVGFYIFVFFTIWLSVDAFIIHKVFGLYSFLHQLYNPPAILCFSLIDLSFIVLQVVKKIGLGCHVRLYVPRQKNTAEEWCCVVQNLAATVLLV